MHCPNPRRAGPVLALAAALAGAAPADASARPRVGVLFWHDSPNDRLAFEGVREGFALGRLDPEYRVVEARGDDAAARAALRGFEEQGFDLVYAMGTGAALRAREEVRRVPVVFTAVTDPVGSGVVASPEGSGRNLCGNSNGVASPEVLAVFRRALPTLATLGVVYDAGNPVSRAEVAEMRRAGAAADPPLALAVLERRAADLERDGGVHAAVSEVAPRCDAIWIPIDIAVYTRSEEAAAAATDARRPVLATAPAAARSAAVCVTVDFRALGRSSVVLAARALRGEDPGKMPVGRMRSLRVILNLEAARRSGLEIPLALVAAADSFEPRAAGR